MEKASNVGAMNGEGGLRHLGMPLRKVFDSMKLLASIFMLVCMYEHITYATLELKVNKLSADGISKLNSCAFGFIFSGAC